MSVSWTRMEPPGRGRLVAVAPRRAGVASLDRLTTLEGLGALGQDEDFPVEFDNSSYDNSYSDWVNSDSTDSAGGMGQPDPSANLMPVDVNSGGEEGGGSSFDWGSAFKTFTGVLTPLASVASTGAQIYTATTGRSVPFMSSPSPTRRAPASPQQLAVPAQAAPTQATPTSGGGSGVLLLVGAAALLLLLGGKRR